VIDEREIVQRAVERLEPPEPSFERLIRRRDRKRRNQRIAAGMVGIAVFVAAVWIVTSVGSFDRSQTPAVPGPAETGPAETGPSVAPDPDAKGVVTGLPPEGAAPSTPESGELVVELNDPGVWVYADGRVISTRMYLRTLEPYSGLVEQHLTPEGVEFLRSNVLATGLFEHDLDLAREDPLCCLEIRVRDGDRLVRVTLGPDFALSDRDAPMATPEQEAALESISALLTSPESWPTSVWTDQQIRAYVPSNYSFCSRFAEPSRVLALLPERACDLLLGAGYPKTDGSRLQPTCARMTTEETRALAEILIAELHHLGGPLGFFLEKRGVPMSSILLAINPVLPHGESAGLAGLG
jgi:hypothetical protein